MTIVSRPSSVASLLGGSIELPVHACGHEPAVEVSPWVGASGTAGTVAVVGAGKMGLPLAAQFADHGWHVVAVDVQQSVVDSINAGRSHVGEEPGLAELVTRAHSGGRLRATTDGAAAARDADVVVLDLRDIPPAAFNLLTATYSEIGIGLIVLVASGQLDRVSADLAIDDA